MILNRDWLWDRKISLRQARNILRSPENERFIALAALLLSRKNIPQEVFKGYLNPLEFLRHWNKIKRQMRKDRWNDPRIEFWQAIYEKLKEKYEDKGLTFKESASVPKAQDAFCKEVADRIKNMRKQKGLTQLDLARRLKVSQQIVSRFESGRENVSLQTLKKVTEGLGARLRVDILVA